MKCYTRHQIFWPAYQEYSIQYSVEGSVKVLDSLRDLMAKRNTKFLVLTTYAGDYPQADKALFIKYQVPYLFLGIDRKAEYSFGREDGHSSQEGHKAIGDALFRALKDSIPRGGVERIDP
jgi:hypothetical protein